MKKKKEKQEKDQAGLGAGYRTLLYSKQGPQMPPHLGTIALLARGFRPVLSPSRHDGGYARDGDGDGDGVEWHRHR